MVSAKIRIVSLALAIAGCAAEVKAPAVPATALSYCDEAGSGVNFRAEEAPCEKLSGYRFFTDGAKQIPNARVIPYALNTPLFSDYAGKHRFLYVPQGGYADYATNAVLDFPAGSVILKTFTHAPDLSKPSQSKVVETRVLVRKKSGWVGYPYVWNDDQTDAVLTIEGASIESKLKHEDGKTETFTYLVPDKNQCKKCHEGLGGMAPIGPKVRNINRLAEGSAINQLTVLAEAGILKGLPSDMASIPQGAVWDDPKSGTLDRRAREYLDNNCAHCHSPTGPARTSGFYLNIEETVPVKYGVCKNPVAAGPGAGGRPYDIVPGNPGQSVLVYRMESTVAGTKMPELGRSLAHTEGVKLITDWVAAMPTTDATCVTP